MRLFLACLSLVFSSQAVSSSVAIGPNDLDEISQIVLVSTQSSQPPCATSPFSSQPQTSPFTFRPGEVGVYSWHMCVWRKESLACQEPLNITYSQIEPGYNPSSGQITYFTGTNFESALDGSMLFQWNMRDNPFHLGLWMPEIGEYQLSVQGVGCSRFEKASVNITMEMPSFGFNKTQSVCPATKYSEAENRVGIFGKNPLYPQHEGCSILYNVSQPSYGARYGFLQIVYDGDIDLTSRNGTGGGSFLTQIMRISQMMNPLVVDCASLPNATSCQTIGNQTRVEANKDGAVLYTGGSLYTFTAPYFSPDSCAPESGSLYQVEQYRNFGTQFLNYLMIKVDPQPGKRSYWVPVRRAGWFSSYEVVCPTPPCGTGLGPNYNTSGSTPWAVNHLGVTNPYAELFWSKAASSPSWNGSFQQSFQVVSKSSKGNDSWFFCPTSLDVVHPSSNSFFLKAGSSFFFLLLYW